MKNNAARRVITQDANPSRWGKHCENEPIFANLADLALCRPVLIERLAKVRFYNRLSADIELGGDLIELLKHFDSKINIHALNRLLHFALVGEIRCSEKRYQFR